MGSYPENITIEVTTVCNQRCEFCFYAQKKLKNLFLPKSRIIDALNEAKKLKVESIRFTGGEPLLRKDIVDILSQTKDLGFYVFLNTNATLINDDLIRKIENNVDNVLISLPAASKLIAKKIGNSNISLKLKNIRKLVRSRIPHIRVGTIISRYLLKNFNQYFNLINYLGIKRWEFYRPMIEKKILKKLPEYNISRQDILKVMNFCLWLRKKGIAAYIPNAVPFCITDDKKLAIYSLKGGQFDDGRERLVLDVRGYFKPSYYIDINLGETITSAINHPFIKKVHSESWLSEVCQKCPFVNKCGGGSRFWAYQKYGDYFAKDPLMKQ